MRLTVQPPLAKETRELSSTEEWVTVYQAFDGQHYSRYHDLTYQQRKSNKKERSGEKKRKTSTADSVLTCLLEKKVQDIPHPKWLWQKTLRYEALSSSHVALCIEPFFRADRNYNRLRAVLL